MNSSRLVPYRNKIQTTVWVISFLVVMSFKIGLAQTITVRIAGATHTAFLSQISGEDITPIDSIAANERGEYIFPLSGKNLPHGLCRISINRTTSIDFVNDGSDVCIATDAGAVNDSLRVITSESNTLFYSFLKLNRAYKTKTDLLLLLLGRYPRDDAFYAQVQTRLNDLQKQYITFVGTTAQAHPTSFIARYIRSAQLVMVDGAYPADRQLAFLKTHALDNVDFTDQSLINSDVFANKSIEYLTYFRNPQLPLELLQKEFMVAVDTLLNKAKAHHRVYRHVTEYLIDGFKRFGFEQVIDYMVNNYVIKDDICLNVKTEGLIKRRMDQARNLRIGNAVPNIVSADEHGNNIQLSTVKSEKTLVVFFASSCPHCTTLLPQLNDLARKHAPSRLKVLAVSLDTKKEDWLAFIKDRCSSLINVADMLGWDGKASTDYFIYATPTMFLLDTDARLIAKPMTIEEVNILLK